MKDAMGELNMTVVVIVAIGAIAGFFSLVLWPNIKDRISDAWDKGNASENGTFNGEAGGGAPGIIIIPDLYK